MYLDSIWSIPPCDAYSYPFPLLSVPSGEASLVHRDKRAKQLKAEARRAAVKKLFGTLSSLSVLFFAVVVTPLQLRLS